MTMQVEISQYWRGVLIQVEHVKSGEVKIGNNSKALFQVPDSSLPQDGIVLLKVHDGQVVIPTSEVVQIKKAGLVQTADVAVSENDVVEVKVAEFLFVIRHVKSVPIVPLTWWENVDVGYTKTVATMLILQLGFLIAVMLTPEVDLATQDDLFKNPEQFRTLMLKPEVKKEQKRIALTKAGAKAAGEEGTVGKKELPKKDTIPSHKGAPVVDKDSREEARAEAMAVLKNLGLSKVAGSSRVFGNGGLGDGLNKSNGGVAGSALGDAGGSGGHGTRGTGIGGGGKGLSYAGFGGGGGKGDGFGQGNMGGFGKKRVRVEPGQITYEGNLSPEEIQRVIKRYMAQIRHCYDMQLQKNPELEGKVSIAWVISPEGLVQSARVAQSTMGDDVVDSCVVRIFNRMEFPKPRGGGIVAVTYPFVFSAAGL